MSPEISRDLGHTPSLSGRLVVAALEHLDRADAAERSVIRMAFLSDLENRLLGSLETGRTRETVAQVVLPELDAWTVVDVLEGDGPRRLSLVHPSFGHPEVLDVLNTGWYPAEGERIGYWAAARARETTIVASDVWRIPADATHSPEVVAALDSLHATACLVVPMWSDGDEKSRLVDGAITFMSTRSAPAFRPEEIEFAEAVTRACGRALRNSRLFGFVNQHRITAEHESRSTSDMLGHVTHELRTPLAAIGGYAELMQMGVRGPVTDAQQQDLQRIRWNQQHLLALITQILSFVRVDTGRMEFVPIELDLGPLVRESGEMLTPLTAEKRQTFSFENCERGRAIAIGDPDKVRQIAINLITNALKYSAADTEVIVRCGLASGRVFVEVQDHGSGIAPDKAEAIFLPFVQLPGGAADRQGGVGLGLAIARRLARGMGGELTVRNADDHGAVFRLSLPAGGQARRVGDVPA